MSPRDSLRRQTHPNCSVSPKAIIWPSSPAVTTSTKKEPHRSHFLKAKQLREAHNVDAVVVTADLSQPHGALDLHAEILRQGLTVDLLVNNAGFGTFAS